MRHLILINPDAKQFRSNPGLRREIFLMFHRTTDIMITDSVSDLYDRFAKLAIDPKLPETTIYAAGGDGTVNQIMNWILNLPEHLRPLLLAVGGGQFNFMAKECGFSSGNPMRNLKRVFSNTIRLQEKQWRPIEIHDSFTDTKRYGGVVANGAVCDVMKWYEKEGKGDLKGVIRITAKACIDSAFMTLIGGQGRVRPTKGTITLDGKPIPKIRFPSMMVGAVNEMLPFCRPFCGPIPDDLCGTVTYFGTLPGLTLNAPFIYFGSHFPLGNTPILNRHTHKVTLKTNNREMLLDGDLLEWPMAEHSDQERTFTISRGPSITLLSAA